MTEPTTIGEIILRRRLHKVPDTELYRPGQYKVAMLSSSDAIVSYVDHDGAACLMPVFYNGEEWVHRTILLRANFWTCETRRRPRGGRLSADAITALNNAKGSPTATKAPQATTT